MPRKGYTTIALPNVLIEQVNDLIKNKKNGYVSKPEFIKEAIRDKIRILKQDNSFFVKNTLRGLTKKDPC
ncbi:hypothetical protein HYU06_07200 [Candidatus Woesearchaeota archaeon]|nr:hypothetical protein [Candidatus Woesearchaeota archaeon]